MSDSPQQERQDHRDLMRICEISNLIHKTDLTKKQANSDAAASLRNFVRMWLAKLPTYVDRVDARQSAFRGGYMKGKHPLAFDYSALVHLMAVHIRNFLVGSVDEVLPDPTSPAVQPLYFTVLSLERKLAFFFVNFVCCLHKPSISNSDQEPH